MEEIASEEGVAVSTVNRSLTEARSRQLMEVREHIEEENNKLRERVQKELSDAFVEGLKRLLEGEKRIALVVDGEVRLVSVDDPKSLLSGLNAYMQATVMKEKPATPQINIQQSSTINNDSSGSTEKMEERIARIRKMQIAARPAKEVVDVESKVIEKGAGGR